MRYTDRAKLTQALGAQGFARDERRWGRFQFRRDAVLLRVDEREVSVSWIETERENSRTVVHFKTIPPAFGRGWARRMAEDVHKAALMCRAIHVTGPDRTFDLGSYIVIKDFDELTQREGDQTFVYIYDVLSWLPNVTEEERAAFFAGAESAASQRLGYGVKLTHHHSTGGGRDWYLASPAPKDGA